MKKQIIFLRGWTPKENYKNYYDFLEKIEIDPYKLSSKKKRWSDTLSKDLWEDFEVLEIERPNKDFADYKAWKIMFEKYIPFIQEWDIFLWHSLWWSFFLKYFDKNPDLLEKFSKIILVAPAPEDLEVEVLGTFKPNLDFKNIRKNQDKITIFASKDDFIVPFKWIESLQKNLNNINYKIFKDRWHFLQEKFEELMEELKKSI